MRVLVRRQGIVKVPFDPCGCATYQATERLNDIVERMREARRPGATVRGATAEQQLDLEWLVATRTAERVPDLLGLMDTHCRVDTLKFNREFQDSIRAKDFHRLVEAVAAIKLRLCGTEVPEGGVMITPDQIREMVARTEREIKEAEAGR